MSTEVKPSDWGALDPWWRAYTQSDSIYQTHFTTQVLDRAATTDALIEIDPWWQTYTDTSSLTRNASSTWLVTPEKLSDSWEDLDSWWDTYTKIGHDTAVEIAELLNESNQEWEQSAAPFDTDPLAAAITQKSGPLLPSIEEEWSDWLANLLRFSPPLVSELFDVSVDRHPDQVIREKQLSKEEGGYRRPDILVRYPERGISIEVKLGDTGYEKTAETAWLTERKYSEEAWTHTLLLPQKYTGRLQSKVEPLVSEHPYYRLKIEWETPGPIPVLYWRDVTMAIRNLLRRAEIVDDHWAANAYLFCAAVEQRIMDFAPQPMIERLAEPTNVVDETQAFTLAGDLEEQLMYLSERQSP